MRALRRFFVLRSSSESGEGDLALFEDLAGVCLDFELVFFSLSCLAFLEREGFLTCERERDRFRDLT